MFTYILLVGFYLYHLFVVSKLESVVLNVEKYLIWNLKKDFSLNIQNDKIIKSNIFFDYVLFVSKCYTCFTF